MPRWRNPRFDLVELCLIVVACSYLAHQATTWLTAGGNPEAAYFSRTYGPVRNSENNEEWIIRDFFGGKRDGFFVDVGANHYQRFSNTYYLETALGWSGLAVEPQREFEADYVKYRPRTRFLPFFVSDVSNEAATMYVAGGNPLVTSSTKTFTESMTGKTAHTIEAPTITLNDLLTHEHVERIDFLNMDIELAEPKALAGFDIERVRPALVCIEAHVVVRQQLIDYFTRHHYVVLGKYLRADDVNLYFAPLDR